MDQSKVITVEACLSPWVGLLPLYDPFVEDFTVKKGNVKYQKILQILEASLNTYIKNHYQSIDLSSAIKIDPKEVKLTTFRPYFYIDYPNECPISCEGAACLLLYNTEKLMDDDLYQSEILVNGCFKSVIFGKLSKQKLNEGKVKKDYCKIISGILNGSNMENKILQISSLINQENTRLNPNSPANLLLAKTRYQNGSKDEAINKIKISEVIFRFLFYSCPQEQTEEIFNLKTLNILETYNSRKFNEDIEEVELQFKHTSFEQKEEKKKRILSNSDIEESGQEDDDVQEIYHPLQSNLRNSFSKLNKSTRIDSSLMKITDFLNISVLPNKELIGLWENLIMDKKLKDTILSNAQVSIILSSFGTSLSKSDKLIILHGPPGTGKSTLAKALFQKLSIKINSSNEEPVNKPSILLLELSPDKIFSRYFGESPKKLSSIFTSIEKTISDTNSFIFLIIDEIETLATDRGKLLSNNETTDGVRIVNILLTHLDRLNKFNNFFMITTSNMIASIDKAFKDRASGMFHLQLPNEKCIYKILENAILQLIELNLVTKNSSYDQLLNRIALYCSSKRLSGRFITRAPMIALTHMFENELITDSSGKYHPIPIDEILVEIANIVANHQSI